ncbi:hypothetical protein LCGC14_2314000 [marine sediment metagenome]|uniref:Uncharacterized protein n=1 Tax=marine sediment metagenome TaxID=412755 RepID=A0A0F9FEM5_9ZZZZ
MDGQTEQTSKVEVFRDLDISLGRKQEPVPKGDNRASLWSKGSSLLTGKYRANDERNTRNSKGVYND